MPKYIDTEWLLLQFKLAKNSMTQHGREYSYSFMDRGELCTEWWCVEQMVEHAPTLDLEPKKEWTPCHKHEPYHNGRYLVTIRDTDVPSILDIIECDYYVHGGWYGFPKRIGQLGTFEIIAWRELDEPYDPSKEKENDNAVSES